MINRMNDTVMKSASMRSLRREWRRWMRLGMLRVVRGVIEEGVEDRGGWGWIWKMQLLVKSRMRKIQA